MMNFNWPEIAKSNKGVRTSDSKACGDVVAEAGDIFFVLEGAIKNIHIEFQNPNLLILMEIK
jgi:hypothetical protein